MAHTHHEHDLRLGLGVDAGPSWSPPPPPLLQAHLRIRPITVRFTEPGVRDLALALHSLHSLRPTIPTDASVSASTPTKADVLFDADFDSDHAAPRYQEQHARDALRHVVSTLNDAGLMGDETVRAVKARMQCSRDAVNGRRLRLIHAGRVLRDGVRLVGYLEELDARQRAQMRQTLRHLALDSNEHDDDDGDASAGSEEDELAASDVERETDQVEKRDLSVRELVDLLAGHTHADGNHEDGGIASACKSKGKSRQPAFFDDVVRVTIRTAPKVYLQCSVGDVQTSTGHERVDTSWHLETAESAAPPLSDADPDEPDGSLRRGFNRLLDAGLSADEIASMRTQFRSTHALEHAYDLIRSREHAAHLLDLEESWMDSFVSTTTRLPGTHTHDAIAATPMHGGGVYSTVMHGLMVGFFMPPLVPLFWFRDRPHPSSLPRGMQQADDDDDDHDDEEQWERERTDQTRDSVFASTMQISILFGIVANLTMGIFRFIW